MKTRCLRKTCLLLIGIQLVLLQGCGPSNKPARGEGQEPDSRAGSDSTDASGESEIAHMAEGETLYTNHCLVCHQVTGGGVSGLNPPLKNTEYVLGDKDQMIRIILRGSSMGLEVNGRTYSNSMPAFSQLSDEEVAYVATYVRNSFGNRATPISPEEVAKARKME